LKRICIIDGQGGGIGATLVRYLKAQFGEIVGLRREPLPHLVEAAVAKLKEVMRHV
jgi:hypothetical protein